MNTPIHWQFSVSANDPIRAARWTEILGSNRAPITTNNTFPIIPPGETELVPCYYLDLAALTREQFDRLTDFLVKENQMPLEAVLDELRLHGLAIAADTCTIWINYPTDEYAYLLEDYEEEEYF